MTDFEFNCPHCNQTLEVPEDVFGSEFPCPACQGSIFLAKTEADVPASLQKPHPSEGINRPCPQCRLPVHRALRRCRHCGAAMDAAPAAAPRYGGIGRLGYILGLLGTTGILAGLAWASFTMKMNSLAYAGCALAFLGNATLLWFRLRNVGMSWWWMILSLVPVVNLYVAFMCVAGPEGYASHRQLDTPGKILVGLLVLSIGAPIIVLAFFGISLVVGLIPQLLPEALAPEPAPVVVEAPHPPVAAASEYQGLTVEDWEAATDTAFLEFPGWLGFWDRAGATVSVGALDGQSAAGGFWTALCRRPAPAIAIVVTAGKNPISVDTTGAKVKYSNGAEKLLPATADFLSASSVKPDECIQKYTGPQTVQPGAAPYVTVLFTGPGFDWSVVRGIILNIDGKPTLVQGKVTTTDEKRRMTGIGRGLHDTRGQP